MRAYSRQELAYHANLIGNDFYCKRPADIAFGLLDRLLPAEKLPLVEYSEKYRKFKRGDGTLTPWTRKGRAAILPLMRAHDNPKFREIVAPKPSRIGGTVVAENYTLRMMHLGPGGRALWYHAEPDGYAQKEFKDIWDRKVHPEATFGLGIGPSDDKLTFKRFGSQYVELMKISNRTTASREGEYIFMDEVDSYSGGWQYRFAEAARQRQAQIGNAAKRYFCSHPDKGWMAGIAQAWIETSQGILVAPCPECGDWASAYPTKYWPDVPKYKLGYQKLDENAPVSDRIETAKATAVIECPNCGCDLDEGHRAIMADTCTDLHKGQILDVKLGPVGEADENEKFGLWLHILFSTQVSLSELAGRLEAAREHFQRTGRADKLRDTLNRAFGEVMESPSEMGLDAASLKRRATDAVETPTGYQMGEIPDGVKFLTLAVDVGGTKKPFDLMVIGWDLQRRRYLIDRRTVRQREHPGGILRDMNPTAVQADWNVLEQEIVRIYPFKSDPDMGLPIAVTTIDIKDGNATPFGVQFLRDMDKRRWKDWRKVRGIMGAKSQEAPEVAVSPKDYNTDTNGRKIEPPITVHNLGVHKLKTDVLETLAIEDGSPGCWNFPTDMPLDLLQQFFNEPYIDGKWIQNGPNESLDLGGHSEAGRQMLEPDRKDRNWTSGSEPIWAKPVSLKPKGGDLAVAGEVEVKKPIAKTPGANLASILGSLDRG